jgi:hypothetical protein
MRSGCPVFVDLQRSSVDLVENNVLGRQSIVLKRELLVVVVDRRVAVRVSFLTPWMVLQCCLS